MSKPIDILMSEHRVIEEVLDSLENFDKSIKEGTGEDRITAGSFAEFFRMFADQCHHGKEEDLLFKELSNLGMPEKSGPIAVMVDEHELGRKCVRRIGALEEGEGPWTPAERDDFHSAVSEFIPLLRQHIQKEDNVLFPAAENLLTPQRIADLNNRFEHFEHDVVGEEGHSRLLGLAKRLSSRWKT